MNKQQKFDTSILIWSVLPINWTGGASDSDTHARTLTLTFSHTHSLFLPHAHGQSFSITRILSQAHTQQGRVSFFPYLILFQRFFPQILDRLKKFLTDASEHL